MIYFRVSKLLLPEVKRRSSVVSMSELAITIILLTMVIFIEPATAINYGRHYWYDEAMAALQRRTAGSPDARSRFARSVVLLVGDGLGMSTVTAARLLKGQRQGRSGEDEDLAWDKFPATAFAKTYNLDGQVGESSACATALLCGVKAHLETVGLDAGGRFDDCASTKGSRVESLVDWAHRAGKSTGFVTNTRVTHATPAALYAHSASRYWEDDGKVPAEARAACKDIARQLVEDAPGINISVILGGGRRHWLPRGTRDPEAAEDGRRLDGRSLVDDWLRDSRARGLRAEYVTDRQGLANVNPSVDRLLGLFAYSHLEFEADRDRSPPGDPSLAEMAEVALSVLQKNANGFFLFIEGGRIDHAHHYNNAYRALDETLALEAALLALLPLVDRTETLLVVTADHASVMTFGGLSTPRGNPILGADSKVSDVDGQPYSTLLYGSGPGFARPRVVPANRTAAPDDLNAVHAAAAPRQWATHGGEDVPIYAQGPLASVVFKGVVEQSYIPHAIAYVLCLGEFSKRCKTLNQTTARQPQACISHDPAAGQRMGGVGGGGKVLASSQDMLSISPRHPPPWPIFTFAIILVILS